MFKRLAVIVGLLVLGSACTSTARVAENAASATQTREAVAAVEPTAVTNPTSPPEPTPTESPAPQDDPTPIPAPTATAVPPKPTVEPTPVPTLPAVADQDHSGLAGTRGLTLQWISWEPEDWGTIEFIPLVDGSYAVNGTQVGPDGDFVSVAGTMVRADDRELLFNGEIVVQVSYTNDGQPCVRGGDIRFLATGDRRFWRMQDLLNCDGVVTDYVDIYFG